MLDESRISLQTAIAHQRAGRFKEAEEMYREILHREPENAQALHLMGILAAQMDRPEVAIDLIGRAVQLNPTDWQAYNNFGNVCLQMGRWDKAVEAYRAALQINPHSAVIYRNLASAIHGTGRVDEAAAALEQAVLLEPENVETQHRLALFLQEMERLPEAINGYVRALTLAPHSAEIHRDYGVALRMAKRLEDSVAALRKSIELQADLAESYNELGVSYQALDRFDEAQSAYRAALEIDPGYAEAQNNLGVVLQLEGKHDEAIAAYREALAGKPDYLDAISNLANALQEKGRNTEAIGVYRRALQIQPDSAEMYNKLGNALRMLGRLKEAYAAFEECLRIAPDFSDAHNNLGVALQAESRCVEALAEFDRAIKLKPDCPEAWNNRGGVLQYTGNIDAAVAAYERAISVGADSSSAYANLANTLSYQGRFTEALANFERAMVLEPKSAKYHSDWLYNLHFHPGYDAASLLHEHRRWNERHASALRAQWRELTNEPRADKRLRIGYVSPDFRAHVAGAGILALLRAHDRSRCEIYCYSSVAHEDATTAQIRALSDFWRPIMGVSDDEAAGQIRADQIDILVDLSVHSAENRLLLFARRPAPVQITYLGYCSTTGMEAMNYRVSDPFLDPVEQGNGSYSEKTVRLARSYWHYTPLGETPEPGRSPAAAGFTTFGSLGNFAKISPGILDLWSKILGAMPRSRLLLHAPEGSCRDRVLKHLGSEGMSAERVEFVAKQGWEGYIRTWQKIDVALDTLPYGGGITTCDALWMGVPVVTLVGATAVGRGGKSILGNLGLKNLVAESPEQYVEIATRLGADCAKREELRRTLRQRMSDSPLRDAGGFARDIESIYNEVWEDWCAR